MKNKNDYYIDYKSPPEFNTLELTSKTVWYKRLWYAISNPFTYVFKGQIRY